MMNRDKRIPLASILVWSSYSALIMKGVNEGTQIRRSMFFGGPNLVNLPLLSLKPESASLENFVGIVSLQRTVDVLFYVKFLRCFVSLLVFVPISSSYRRRLTKVIRVSLCYPRSNLIDVKN